MWHIRVRGINNVRLVNSTRETVLGKSELTENVISDSKL